MKVIAWNPRMQECDAITVHMHRSFILMAMLNMSSSLCLLVQVYALDDRKMITFFTEFNAAK